MEEIWAGPPTCIGAAEGGLIAMYTKHSLFISFPDKVMHNTAAGLTSIARRVVSKFACVQIKPASLGYRPLRLFLTAAAT